MRDKRQVGARAALRIRRPAPKAPDRPGWTQSKWRLAAAQRANLEHYQHCSGEQELITAILEQTVIEKFLMRP